MTKSKFTFVSDTQEDIAERKKSLRAYMKTRRADNENRDIKEILLIENTLALIDEISKKKGAGARLSAFCYLSFSSEAPTDALIERLIERGCLVYCPRIENKEMQAVLYGEDMQLSSLGIREPVGEAYEGEIDIAVAPMLAVDENGNRLGYGGGYYDRFFSRHKEMLSIAYGYDFQIVKSVPTEPFDERVDAIVTDKRLIQITKEIRKLGEN